MRWIGAQQETEKASSIDIYQKGMKEHIVKLQRETRMEKKRHQWSAKDVEFLDSIEDIYEAVGIDDFETKLLGGLDILVKCRSREVALKIITDPDHRLHTWINKLRM
ncbi:hypothetical protein Tco_1465933 [Tanacetum coccineum]